MKKTRSFVMSRENWILEALEKAGEVFKRNALVPLLPHPFPAALPAEITRKSGILYSNWH